tara:strand:+ start:1692 stop:1976 length:285 start_codon:yes stop_codon:yes gene_type:complete
MPKKNNDSKKSKKVSKHMSKDKYNKLIKKHKTKKLSKKDKKILDKELFKNYCSCIKKVKRSKNKKISKGRYGICMSSIYKKRNIDPPYNASRKC